MDALLATLVLCCAVSPLVAGTSHCGSGSFACVSRYGTKRCIPTSWLCDGDRDCFDISDEQNCTRDGGHCKVGEFACRSHFTWRPCVPGRWVCDGTGQCVDDSDEKHCDTTSTTTTTTTTTTAATTTDATDITTDGTTLSTGSSEISDGTTVLLGETSSGPGGHCPAGQFACQLRHDDSLQRYCIVARWLCDGSDDCIDFPDEKNCASNGQGDCVQGEFACNPRHGSRSCIPGSRLCDGHNDCVDNSDEKHCRKYPKISDETTEPSWETSGSGNGGYCDQGEFACRSRHGSRPCIPGSWRCDGHNDCVDNSDEKHCRRFLEIGDDTTELPWQTSGSGPVGHCPAGQFACQVRHDNSLQRYCITAMSLCDGWHDCIDFPDEGNCDRYGGYCSRGSFACLSRYGTERCIPGSWLCDGHNDCVDNSDEHHCRTSTETSDETTEPLGETSASTETSDETTEPLGETNSGSTEISDGTTVLLGETSSDAIEITTEEKVPQLEESSIPATQQTCSEEQFLCASRRWRGGCIPLVAVCDARAGDCDDGSDESHCGAQRTCPEHWLACASGRCLPPAKICDGELHCPDGSDETHCDSVEMTSPVSDETTELLGETNSATSTPAPALTTTTGAARTCPERWLTCASGSCVPPALVCDGLLQCPDGADERQCGDRDVVSREVRGDAVRLELHFALSLAPMPRARAPRDKLDAQMAVLRLFQGLAQN